MTDMTLQDAYRRQVPLEIEPRTDECPGLTRLIIALVIGRDGLAFADDGWLDPTYPGHCVHVVEGVVTGTNPWRCGSAVVRELPPDHPDFAEAMTSIARLSQAERRRCEARLIQALAEHGKT